MKLSAFAERAAAKPFMREAVSYVLGLELPAWSYVFAAARPLAASYEFAPGARVGYSQRYAMSKPFERPATSYSAGLLRAAESYSCERPFAAES